MAEGARGVKKRPSHRRLALEEREPWLERRVADAAAVSLIAVAN